MNALKYSGYWNINNDYKKNDLVYYLGNIYKAPIDIKKSTTIDKWSLYMDSEIIDVIMREKGYVLLNGKWKYSHEYKKGDLVFCNNISYICENSIENSYYPPGEDNENWKQITGSLVKQSKPLICELKNSIILSLQDKENDILRISKNIFFNNILSIDNDNYEYIESTQTMHIIMPGTYKCTYNVATNAVNGQLNNLVTGINISDDDNMDDEKNNLISVQQSICSTKNNYVNHTCYLIIKNKSTKITVCVVMDVNKTQKKEVMILAKKTWLLMEKICK